jgi:hypothetical protein
MKTHPSLNKLIVVTGSLTCRLLLCLPLLQLLMLPRI